MDKIIEAFHDIRPISFQEFLRSPRNPLCPKIDANRLIVEFVSNLWGFDKWSLSSKILLWGEYSLIMRYKRESDGKYRPTCVLSMNFERERVVVTQLQWSKDKHVAYRFSSSLDTVWYFGTLLEEAFIKRGISVEVERCPEWIEWVAHNSQAIDKYNTLANMLVSAKQRFWFL